MTFLITSLKMKSKAGKAYIAVLASAALNWSGVIVSDVVYFVPRIAESVLERISTD